MHGWTKVLTTELAEPSETLAVFEETGDGDDRDQEAFRKDVFIHEMWLAIVEIDFGS